MKQAINKQEAAIVSKKKMKAEIIEKLETTFASLLPILGKKKFNKRIKKAEKILLHNVNGTKKINGTKTAKINFKKADVKQ